MAGYGTKSGIYIYEIATFAVTEPVVAAYEYCNLHGLWKKEAAVT